MADISFLINAHREGVLLQSALLSAQAAQRICEAEEIRAEIVVVLDRPDGETLSVIGRWDNELDRVEVVDFGSLARSRMYGVQGTSGTFVAFLDGDDVWQPEWPLMGYKYALESDALNTIYHTEIFAAFGDEIFLRKQIDTADRLFHPNHLVSTWHYCNNLLAHRSIFERVPIQDYDHERGYGSEDWHWSCETCNAGIARVSVPETAYFYRRRHKEVSLGTQPWLALRETALFQKDESVLSFGDRLGHLDFSGSLLRELDAVRHSAAAPSWLRKATAGASVIDPEIWTLRTRLADEQVHTPRLYNSISAAFAEIRRLYDDTGRFGIIIVRSEGRAAGFLGKCLLAIGEIAKKHAVVVGLDRCLRPDQPICRLGNALYINVTEIFDINGPYSYPLAQLFVTTFVQLRPLFFLNVEHWLGETLSNYRTVISGLEMRYAFVGMEREEDGSVGEVARMYARVQNGGAWYNEIWVGAAGELSPQVSALIHQHSIKSVVRDRTDICDLLIAAAQEPIVAFVPNQKSPLPASISPAPRPIISCILNVHREREVVVPTLLSVFRMMDFAHRQGIASELLIVCDASDQTTIDIIKQYGTTERRHSIEIVEANERDLGRARNIGIGASRGEFACLLDGDDLYSENWLTGAMRALALQKGADAAIHPAVSVYFGRETRYFWHSDWADGSIPSRALLFDNCWTSLSFATRELYVRVPFLSADLNRGLAFEDWQWNLDVIGAGGTHVAAPETCHFVRLKESGSLNRRSADLRCVTRTNQFLRDLVLQ